jgi:hypothetical protein
MIPPLHAALGAKPAEYPTNGVEDGSGPLATLKSSWKVNGSLENTRSGLPVKSEPFLARGGRCLGRLRPRPTVPRAGASRLPPGQIARHRRPDRHVEDYARNG